MGMDGRIILFSVLIVLVAILSKVVGCGFGAKLCGYTSKESYRIGIGMVIITTLITPIWLKFAYKERTI